MGCCRFFLPCGGRRTTRARVPSRGSAFRLINTRARTRQTRKTRRAESHIACEYVFLRRLVVKNELLYLMHRCGRRRAATADVRQLLREETALLQSRGGGGRRRFEFADRGQKLSTLIGIHRLDGQRELLINDL
jgi:hypothetical protein